MSDVSKRLIDSGLAELVFTGSLQAPVAEYKFSVHIDPRGRVWLQATRQGGSQLALLHPPPQPVNKQRAVLTAAQWDLAKTVGEENE